MGAFGSRGGLFMNAPLKDESCTTDDAKDLPNLRRLDKEMRRAGLGKLDPAEAACSVAKSFQGQGENR
jgi:hypothetical protein